MNNQTTILPDGSGFTTVSMPLPKTHWIYKPCGEPPAPWRVGEGEQRIALAKDIWDAGKWAVKGATMSGKDEDFDPDALVQNLVVGLLGYWTEDGK